MGNENEILKKALGRFEELTNQKTVIKYPVKGFGDALIRIPGLKINAYVEIKLNVTNQTLGAVVHQIKTNYTEERIILITRYVTPPIADKLKELDMQFLDTAGNAYFNFPNMFLFIKGNKNKEETVKEKPSRAFQPAGLQLIYALLCIPGLENKPYRTMAETANIANGAVTWAMKDLKKLGYIVDMGEKGRHLVKKNELLQRWVNLYAELLRPRLIIGRYRTEIKDWWQHENIINLNAQYSGETAAALITKYLKPENHIIFTEENNGKLLYQLKFKTDPNGNIELLKKFWHFDDEWNNNKFVNPILVYADLLVTGDERNIETAKIIYDKEIIRYIGQN